MWVDNRAWAAVEIQAVIDKNKWNISRQLYFSKKSKKEIYDACFHLTLKLISYKEKWHESTWGCLMGPAGRQWWRCGSVWLRGRCREKVKDKNQVRQQMTGSRFLIDCFLCDIWFSFSWKLGDNFLFSYIKIKIRWLIIISIIVISAS